MGTEKGGTSMQWETTLLLHLAAPFVIYYLICDRIQQMKRKRAEAKQKAGLVF